ncbi:MAG TPA: NnrU family protein [Burkholderiaceae bacterium]|jgi:uncharacterized membrane protein|nr:NnrU family protein [Burkholderiaceae bacterium]
MVLLVLGMIIFIGIHLVPSFAPVRAGLMQRLGPGRYKGIFSLVSLVGLLLLALGKAHAAFVPVWTPPFWTRHLALALMPFSLILLAAAYLPGNIRRATRHPMLWGVVLWAVVHLLANGDLASILLFGGFSAYSLYAMHSANRRGATKSTVRQPVAKDLLAIGAGLAAYLVLLFLHPLLFGVSPFV